MGIMGTLFALFRHPLVGLFTADPAVLTLGGGLMVLAATFQIFDAMSIGYGSALRGAGDTKWPAIVLGVYCYAIVIVGGWALTVLWPGTGSYGPWIMCTIYAILLSLTLRYRWVRGDWKTMDIFADAYTAVASVESRVASESHNDGLLRCAQDDSKRQQPSQSLNGHDGSAGVATAGDANARDGRLQEDGSYTEDELPHEGQPRPARAGMAETLARDGSVRASS
jgi:hypothetical protein